MTFSISVSGSTKASPYVGLPKEQVKAMQACAAQVHEALEGLRAAGFTANGSFYHSDLGSITL